MILYGYWRSSCSWRVRIALALKNIPYTNVPVHLVQDGGQQHHPEYRNRNPMAQVPSLELEDGTVINQSLAIVQWLDEVYPSPSLLGTAAKERAFIWELAEMINAGTQPLQNLSLLQHVVRNFSADKMEWGRHFITLGLDAFAQRIRKNELFSTGSEVRLPEICLIPQLYNARRFSCDMSRWPKLLEIEKRCQQRPAFQHAHPNQQPDAQL